MKTISGKLVSSKPVSLSKAANYISGFASVENGASDAMYVYLRRTSDAFNSLVQLHKELKASSSNRSQALDSDVKSQNLVDNGEEVEGQVANKRKKKRDAEVYGRGDSEAGLRNEGGMEIGEGAEVLSEKKRKNKHKREMMQNEEPLNIVRSSDEIDDVHALGLEGAIKREKFEYGNGGIEPELLEVEEGTVKKRNKKKRKRIEGKEPGTSLGIDYGLKEKSRDGDDGEAVDLTKRYHKKTKRRKKTNGDN